MDRKRRRTATRSVASSRARRPIGKFLINVGKADSPANTQQQVILMDTAQTPGTITGLRWDLAFCADSGSAGQIQDVVWAIIVVRGASTPLLSLSDASALSDPLKQVIAFGSGMVVRGQAAFEEHGNTKSMRKLDRTDRLLLLFKTGADAVTVRARGSVQFFYRT